MILDEPEVLDGMRAYEAAQAAFVGPPDPNRTRHSILTNWYDTQTDDNEGYFCLINAGSVLEELIGDVVEVRYENKMLHVYCIGAANLTTDFALQRHAYFRLAMLNTEAIRVTAQAVQRG